MARRSHRPRGRRRNVNWIYIIPVLLIVAVGIAYKYGPFGKDKNQYDTTSITNNAEADVPELNGTEPEIVREPAQKPERTPEPLPELPPKPAPKPILPEVVSKPNLPEIISVPDVEPNPEAAKLIAEATALLSENPSKVIDARSRLKEALRIPMSVQQRTFVKDQLSELADKWLFSREIFPDDKLCGSLQVKPGDQLRVIGKQFKVPYEILMGINNISQPQNLRAGEVIKVISGPFHAKVYRSTFTMDLYLQETFVRSFRVGLGKSGSETPTGLWRVKTGGKLIKPVWTNPLDGKTYYPEDQDYPLGSRWIGLEGLEGAAKGRTGFALHGTKDPEQIGTADSQGCIRLHNGNAILLYNLFEEGLSTVEVVE
ncbi:MAG TPA: L,D-transpeptidase family protein [Sedimentisphaerales bacterium]|nr:L,D-transpeptidase family protein [Sedimentisphaerales bacterium]